MKLEHSTVVTNDGKKTITSTWHTDSGKTTSQTIKSTDLKSGKVTTTYVSGGKLLPLPASAQYGSGDPETKLAGIFMGTGT